MVEKRLLHGLLIAILILLGMIYKEKIEEMSPDDHYIHPSSIYDSRGDDVIYQSTAGENSPSVVGDTIIINYE